MLRLRFLSYANYKYVEDWYNKMYQDGWEFSKQFLNIVHIFKKAEDTNKVFRFFPVDKHRAWSGFSREEMDDYHEMCRSYGWEFVNNFYNLDLYYTDRPEEAKDIFSNKEDGKLIIKKAFKRDFWVTIITYLFLIFILLGKIKNFFDMDLLLHDYYIFNSVAIILFVLGMLPSVLEYVCFIIANRKKWEGEEDLTYYNFSIFSIEDLLIILAIISFILSVIYPVFKDKTLLPLVSILPTTFGISVGLFIRNRLHTSENLSLAQKKVFSILAIIGAGIVGGIIPLLFINGNQGEEVDKTDYKSSLFIEKYYEEEYGVGPGKDYVISFYKARDQWVLEKLETAKLKDLEKVYNIYKKIADNWDDYYLVELDGEDFDVDRAYFSAGRDLVLVNDLDVWVIGGNKVTELEDMKTVVGEILGTEK